MQPEKLAHFRTLLVAELGKHNAHIREDQAAALEASDNDVKDTVDLSVQDVNKELALRLGERESQMLADIDQALFRIKEGNTPRSKPKSKVQGPKSKVCFAKTEILR